MLYRVKLITNDRLDELLMCELHQVTDDVMIPGSPEEKSKLMFSMNDIGGTGYLSKEEFARMLRLQWCLFVLSHKFSLHLRWAVFTLSLNCRSFIEISNGALSKKQAEDGIKAMIQTAGLNEKEEISWENFHFLLMDHDKELQFAQLNVKGWIQFSLRSVTFYFSFLMYLYVCFAHRNGKTRKETAEPRPESFLHLSSKQVKKITGRVH